MEAPVVYEGLVEHFHPGLHVVLSLSRAHGEALWKARLGDGIVERPGHLIAVANGTEVVRFQELLPVGYVLGRGDVQAGADERGHAPLPAHLAGYVAAPLYDLAVEAG